MRLLVLACLLFAACAEEVADTSSRCPCGEGFVCCTIDDVCLPEDELCGVREDPPFAGTVHCRSLTDFGNDGTVDLEQRLVVDGLQASSTFDYGLDGSIDAVAETLYDDRGRFLTSRYDSQLDDDLDNVTNQTYDTLGRVSMYEQIWPSSIHGNLRRDYRYDGPRPVEKLDYLRDGHPEAVIIVTLDHLQRTVRREYDLTNDTGQLDGVIDTVLDLEYGPHGISRQTWRGALAGDLQAISASSYDPAGNLTEIAWDQQADGEFEEFERFAYDEQDRLTSYTFEAQPPRSSYRQDFDYVCE